MAHNVESMFTRAVLPWHYAETKDRVKVADRPPKTVEELLQWSGTDWEVVQHPVLTLTADAVKRLEAGDEIDALPMDDLVQIVDQDGQPAYWANVRGTDGETLGIVGAQYEPFQNEASAEFVMQVLETKMARFETGGSLRGGRMVWYLAHLDDDDGKLADGTNPERYLLVSNAHDGSHSLRAMLTHVRVECNNTLDMAIGGARTVWTMRHTESIHDAAEQARAALTQAHESSEQFRDLANRLITRPFAKRDFVKVSADLYPMVKASDAMTEQEIERLNTRRERLLEVWLKSPNIENVRDTAWGAWNAIVEFVDHGRNYRSDETRMIALMTDSGSGRAMKQRALQAITRRSGVKLNA